MKQNSVDMEIGCGALGGGSRGAQSVVSNLPLFKLTWKSLLHPPGSKIYNELAAAHGGGIKGSDEFCLQIVRLLHPSLSCGYTPNVHTQNNAQCVLLSFGFDEWVRLLCASCEFEEMELQEAAVHISRKFKRHVPPEEEKQVLLLFSFRRREAIFLCEWAAQGLQIKGGDVESKSWFACFSSSAWFCEVGKGRNKDPFSFIAAYGCTNVFNLINKLVMLHIKSYFALGIVAEECKIFISLK